MIPDAFIADQRARVVKHKKVCLEANEVTEEKGVPVEEHLPRN